LFSLPFLGLSALAAAFIKPKGKKTVVQENTTSTTTTTTGSYPIATAVPYSTGPTTYGTTYVAPTTATTAIESLPARG
jgi:hypothetical protein